MLDRLDIILRTALPMVFDDSITGLEMLGKIVAQVNTLTDMVNDFTSQDIVTIIEGIIDDYKDDGTLAGLIDVALTTKIDTVAGTGWTNETVKGNADAIEAIKLVMVNVQDYGAVGDGATDDTAAIAAAVAYLKTIGGGTLYFPQTSDGYLTDEITLDADYLFIRGDGKGTAIKAKSNGQTIVRLAGSNGGVSNIHLSGNNKTGVRGLALVPANEIQVDTVVHQNFNVISNMMITLCDNGIELKAGPDVAGTDSGCWYNCFDNIHIKYCLRGIWLRSGVNNSSSPPNRNSFTNVRVGQSCNTGVQIDAGDTNTFFALALENIQTGTAPNGTPTGLIVKQSEAWGLDNNNNRFYGLTIEAATVDIVNENAYSEFYGTAATGTITLTAKPNIMLGGDSSQLPSIIKAMGLECPAGSSELEASKPVIDAGGGWQDFPLLISDMTNVAVLGSQKPSKFIQANSMVDWHFRMSFQASAAGDQVIIKLPKAANEALYRTYATVPPMTFPVAVLNGSNTLVTTAIFDAAAQTLHVNAPAGNWTTAAASNQIWGMIRYHI